jgi:hypothetical protein
MARLVWFVLNDGRSVVAGCEAATRDTLVHALSRPGGMLTLSSDGIVECIPSSSVRDFIVFDARSRIPEETSIYRHLRL